MAVGPSWMKGEHDAITETAQADGARVDLAAGVALDNCQPKA